MKQRSTKAKVTIAALVGFAALATAGLSQTANAAMRHNERQYAAASTWAYRQFRASEESPYPERVTANGTLTGPIPHSANGG